MAVDKLIDSTALNSDITSIANAVRTKGNTSASLTFPTGIVNAINAISTGTTPSGNKSITASTSTQSNIDVASYATVSVAPTPSETKNIVSNGTTDASDGKYMSSVVVNVPIPQIAKWYSTRNWSQAQLATNLTLKSENWTNSLGTTGIYVGDLIVIDVTTTDTNREYQFIIEVTSMDGTMAIGDAIAAIEKGSTVALNVDGPLINVYTGSGAPTDSVGVEGDIYLKI